MFNSVILSGRLTADPELKTTPSGISVTSFNVAVNGPKNKDGEQRTDFITVVAWRSTAEFIAKYFRKGNLIGIEGSIQTRNYEDKNGNKRTAFEVVAYQVHFLESKRYSDQESDSSAVTSNANATDFSEIGTDEDLPF